MKKNRYGALFENRQMEEKSLYEKSIPPNSAYQDELIDAFFCRQIEAANPHIDSETADRMFSRIQTGLSETKKTARVLSLWKKVLSRAAIFVLPLLSAFATYQLTNTYYPSGKNEVTVMVPKGEKAIVTLADGSRVQINSGSTLTYNGGFNRKERRVHLSGEAFFEVAKKPKTPFVVETHEMEVLALGTSFNVRAYAEDCSAAVVLIDGKVQVQAAEQVATLTENQRAMFTRSTDQLIIDNVQAADFTAWMNGSLYFQNQSLDAIVLTLSRVFDVEIQIMSEQLRPISFTGTVCASSIRTVLDILSLTSPITYRMNGTVIELHYRSTH